MGLRSHPLRRFCGALPAADALSAVMFLACAKDAADSLTNYYTFLAQRADGRPLMLRFENGACSAVTGLLVRAERTGVTACAAYPSWAFMMTQQFICAPPSPATAPSSTSAGPVRCRRYYPRLPASARDSDRRG